jgi:hypothetical protein
VADQVVTLAQVKARLEVTDVTDDALIGELIDELTDWLQDVTGRKLVPEAGATYYVDTAPGSVIPVRRGIRAVTSLSIAAADQPDVGSGAYTAVTAADVLIRPAAINRKPGWPGEFILIKGSTGTGRLSQALNGAKIVGDFGFATVPPVIQGVALDAIVTAYTSKRGGASDVIGADGIQIYPWAKYFSAGSPQRATVMRYRAGAGIG